MQVRRAERFAGVGSQKRNSLQADGDGDDGDGEITGRPGEKKRLEMPSWQSINPVIAGCVFFAVGKGVCVSCS